MEQSQGPFTQFLPIAVPYQAMVERHNQDFVTDAV